MGYERNQPHPLTLHTANEFFSTCRIASRPSMKWRESSNLDVYAITTPYEFLIHGMSGALNKAVDDGVITRAELDEWLAEQAAAHPRCVRHGLRAP
jgi:hypothetical protein